MPFIDLFSYSEIFQPVFVPEYFNLLLENPCDFFLYKVNDVAENLMDIEISKDFEDDFSNGILVGKQIVNCLPNDICKEKPSDDPCQFYFHSYLFILSVMLLNDSCKNSVLYPPNLFNNSYECI